MRTPRGRRRGGVVLHHGRIGVLAVRRRGQGLGVLVAVVGTLLRCRLAPSRRNTLPCSRVGVGTRLVTTLAVRRICLLAFHGGGISRGHLALVRGLVDGSGAGLVVLGSDAVSGGGAISTGGSIGRGSRCLVSRSRTLIGVGALDGGGRVLLGRLGAGAGAVLGSRGSGGRLGGGRWGGRVGRGRRRGLGGGGARLCDRSSSGGSRRSILALGCDRARGVGLALVLSDVHRGAVAADGVDLDVVGGDVEAGRVGFGEGLLIAVQCLCGGGGCRFWWFVGLCDGKESE